jgi:type VI secretion system protein ImpL
VISRFFRNVGALFKTPWFVALCITLFLVFLVWLVGPLVAIADYVLLDTIVARLVATLILIFCWGLFLVFHYGNKRKKELADPERAQLVEEQERDRETFKEEIDYIRRRIKAVVKTVTSSSFYGSKNRSRYVLPWYLLLGNPNCGKTAFLLNSGLKFPLNEQADRYLYQLKATEHCETLYSNDAIFFDTPGKYAEARPNSPAHMLWMSLLKYLFRARPARPLNGIIVCVSMRDIMDNDAARRQHLARNIRTRLSEILKRLRSYVPVYLVFTKCDAVPGFAQFFAHLSRTEREQMFGCPSQENSMSPDVVRTKLKELMQILNAQIVSKIHRERDMPSRGDMFRFPQELAGLGPRLEDFIFEAFGPSRYHKPVMFRGFYFTSALSSEDIFAATAKEGEVTLQTGFHPSLSDYIKGFFINKLLQEGIISEARLANADKEQVWGIRMQRHGLQLAAGALFLFLAAFLGVSFVNNYSRIEKLEIAYSDFAKEQRQIPKILDAKTALPELAKIEDTTGIYSPREDSIIQYRLGLYYGNTFAKATHGAYLGTLNARLMPALRADAADKIDRSLAADHTELRKALIAYLMLCQPKYLSKKYVDGWLAARWSEKYLGQAEVQNTLQHHMDYLVAHGIIPVEPDADLLDRARKALLKTPFAELVYQKMKEEAEESGAPSFTFRAAIGQSPFAGDTFPIPHLYTKTGYDEYLIKRCPDIIRSMTSDSWIFGSGIRLLSVLDINKIHKDVRAMYFRDYIKFWNQAVQALKIHTPNTLADAQNLAEQLTAGLSPTVLVLREIRANTTFVMEQTAPPSKVEAALAAETQRKVQQKLAPKVGGRMARALTEQGRDKAAELREKAAEESQRDAIAVRQHFMHLDALLMPDGTPNASLKAANDNMAGTGQYLNKLINSDNREQRVLTALLEIADEKDDTLRNMEIAAERLPTTVRAWYSTVAPGGLRAMLLMGAQAINRMYLEKVISVYDKNLRSYYPFTLTAEKDVNLDDFANFFRNGGALDSFYDTYLRPFAHRNGSLRSIMGRQLPISGMAATQLLRANRIQEAFFMSGRELGIHFVLEPHALDATIKQVDLTNGGKGISYWHGLVQGASFNWPLPADKSTAATLEFVDLNGNAIGSKAARGDWALFRLFYGGAITRMEDNTCLIEVQENGKWAQFLIQFRNKANPFDPTVCSFTLPDSLL